MSAGMVSDRPRCGEQAIGTNDDVVEMGAGSKGDVIDHAPLGREMLETSGVDGRRGGVATATSYDHRPGSVTTSAIPLHRRSPMPLRHRDHESHGQAGQETVVRGCEVDPAVASVTVEAPQRIEVEDGARMTITWEDDRVDRFSAAVLRRLPCAGCREVASAAPTPVSTRCAWWATMRSA